jgi:hypothetical protein
MSSLEKLEALAKQLSHKEWFVLGSPWAGYTDTFTILGGSPDPHVADAILETVAIEDADEDEDHARQEALAEWLELTDPQAILSLLAEHRQLIERVEVLEGALKPFADASHKFDPPEDDDGERLRSIYGEIKELNFGDLRAARKALGADS